MYFQGLQVPKLRNTGLEISSQTGPRIGSGQVRGRGGWEFGSRKLSVTVLAANRRPL